VEKTQVNQTVLRPADSDSRKNRLFVVFAACILLGIGIVVSLALLGGSLGRFSLVETNVIPLIQSENTRPGSNPPSGAASPQSAGGAVGRAVDYRGKLSVFDDAQTWGSETQVDLFLGSYNGTVVSGNGEKVIAPGTSNFYGFALKNNGNIPLDYTVSLKVESLSEEQAADPGIPLEWRLLDGEKAPLTLWREYGEQEETLKCSMLDVRRQDNYTIEWRWPYERGADQTDTKLGDEAVNRLLGVKATITVFAEQSADWDGKPTGPWWLPKTGDDFPLYTYLTVAGVSLCGLLILFVIVKRRKKDKEDRGE